MPYNEPPSCNLVSPGPTDHAVAYLQKLRDFGQLHEAAKANSGLQPIPVKVASHQGLVDAAASNHMAELANRDAEVFHEIFHGDTTP
jgi:hypothetical protein